jgi:RimJ/RimL family protein N-acetyltransferase
MSHSTALRILDGPKDRELIRAWFADDEEGNRRLEFYAQPELWFSLLGPTRRGWFIIEGDHPVGFIDMEIDGDSGYIAYYVAPEYRGLGYGNQALQLMLDQARELGLAVLDGGVDPDNAASIAALKRAGFEIGPLDEEDMLPVTISL